MYVITMVITLYEGYNSAERIHISLNIIALGGGTYVVMALEQRTVCLELPCEGHGSASHTENIVVFFRRK